eukprot:scaffold23675_cov108-Cylindrotheca_fusiformis.AAC.6
MANRRNSNGDLGETLRRASEQASSLQTATSGAPSHHRLLTMLHQQQLQRLPFPRALNAMTASMEASFLSRQEISTFPYSNPALRLHAIRGGASSLGNTTGLHAAVENIYPYRHEGPERGFGSATGDSASVGDRHGQPIAHSSSSLAQVNDPFVAQACLEILGKRSLLESPYNQSQVGIESGTSASSHSSRQRRKRTRITQPPPEDSSSEDDSSDTETAKDTKWNARFQELVAFKEKHDHCNVPQRYYPNLALSQWVKRQRYQYKCKLEGKSSPITKGRIQKLNRIGFVWDAQEMLWRTRFEELTAYKEEHGDCEVPSCYSKRPKLPLWIKCQKRQYKLLLDGKPSNMTEERLACLQSLGLELRTFPRQQKKTTERSSIV